eukprot:2442903-Prymnesium_polylepis.1
MGSTLYVSFSHDCKSITQVQIDPDGTLPQCKPVEYPGPDWSLVRETKIQPAYRWTLDTEEMSSFLEDVGMAHKRYYEQVAAVGLDRTMQCVFQHIKAEEGFGFDPTVASQTWLSSPTITAPGACSFQAAVGPGAR